MKFLLATIVGILVVWLVSLYLVGCDKDRPSGLSGESNELRTLQDDIIYDDAFKNVIGFIDDETGEFTRIGQENMTFYWKNTFEIDDSVEFDIYKIVKHSGEEGGEYFLNTVSDDGTI